MLRTDHGPTCLSAILDNDVFTGRELKGILRRALGARADLPGALTGTQGEKARWISLEYAATLLQLKPDTLRKRCVRWHEMQHPPVRVRKNSDAPGAHWLLDEDDVHCLRRSDGAPAPEVRVSDSDKESAWVDDIVAQAMVTYR